MDKLKKYRKYRAEEIPARRAWLWAQQNPQREWAKMAILEQTGDHKGHVIPPDANPYGVWLRVAIKLHNEPPEMFMTGELVSPRDVWRHDECYPVRQTDWTRYTIDRPNSGHEQANHAEVWWCPPDTDTLDVFYDQYHRAGMSRSVARDQAWQKMKQFAEQDLSDKYFVTVEVLEHEHGRVIAEDALAGVDDDDDYMAEVIDELAYDAVNQAREVWRERMDAHAKLMQG